MKVYFDTAVLVASSVEEHVHYHRARPVVKAVRDGEIDGYVSAHVLAEFYSVITVTPFRSRVFPEQAWRLLSDNVLPNFKVIDLSTEDYRNAIHSSALSGWMGGRVYDMLHIVGARKANCERIYTFNVRHFRQLAPELSERIIAP